MDNESVFLENQMNTQIKPRDMPIAVPQNNRSLAQNDSSVRKPFGIE